MQHSYSKLIVDLNQLLENLKLIKKYVNRKLLFVMKANGYGIGAVQLIPVLTELPDIVCGVAVVDEALELRQSDYLGSILVMGYTPPEQYKLALRHFLDLSIFRPETIQQLEDAAAELGTIAKVHIKLDTGMRRAGVTPEGLDDFVDCLVDNPHISVEGIFSHLAGTANSKDRIIPEQIRLFTECAERIEKRLKRSVTKHLANSLGTLSFPESRLDMVRIGILALGYYPPGYEGIKPGVMPVFTWKTMVVDVRRVPAGTGVSYGHLYTTKEETNLATIPLGYADGIPTQFFPKGQVLINGKRRTVAGAVNMDYVILDVGKDESVYPGAEAVLIGRQKDEEITLDEFATWCGTNNYDIICRIGRRVKREVIPIRNF